MSSTYPPYIEYFWLPATLSHSLVALVTVQSFSVKSGNYSAGFIRCRAGEFSQKAWAGYVREFFLVGLSQLTTFKVGKFGFFHLPAGRSYFWLNYITRHSHGHFTGVFHDLSQIYFILANLGSKASIGSFV